MLFFTNRVRAAGLCALIAASPFAMSDASLAAAPSPQDLTFAAKAAQGGTAEVGDAKQALQTSRNPWIDTFANRMIADHSRANAQLAAIMRQQHIAPPASIGAENQATYSRIEALTGKAFDVAYLAAEKTAHRETIDLFAKEARLGADPQLVAFAKATLPVVKMHLAMLLHGR